jgi:molybdopterin/thiamine biosynthesis adenylyltransferase
MAQLKRKGNIGQGAMDDLYKSIFSRNIGFFTESEQEKLRRSTIAIAGVGGIGGLLAERLIRLGIGHLKIIDPGTFEHSNLNRQFCSSMLNLGQNKAEAVFMHIKGINPQAEIQYSNTGTRTQSDATLFVSDCDLVVDAMDFGLFKEAVYLQRAARQKGIYYIFASAIGFGALAVVFDPDGLTLEEYNKLPPDIDLENNEEPKVPLERVCPVIPSYSVPSSVEAEEIMCEIIAGERPAPTNSIGVGLASILAANETVNIILRKREIASAPQYTYIDLVDRQFLVGSVL